MNADDLRTMAAKLLFDPVVWSAGTALIAILFAIAWHFRRRHRIERILGGASSVPVVHYPGPAAKSLSALEGELKQSVFDPSARERLIKDAMQRRKVDRQSAIRIVLEELRDEHDRYG